MVIMDPRAKAAMQQVDKGLTQCIDAEWVFLLPMRNPKNILGIDIQEIYRHLWSLTQLNYVCIIQDGNGNPSHWWFGDTVEEIWLTS